MGMKIGDYLKFPDDPLLPRGLICTIIPLLGNYFEINGIGVSGKGWQGRADPDFGRGKVGWHGRNR